MKKCLAWVLAAILVASSVATAQAALMTPIALTSASYNSDAVWAAAGDPVVGQFGSPWSWYENAAGRNGGVNGLPTSGVITGTGATFQLAAYSNGTANNNNVLALSANGAGTMTLATPGQFSALSVLSSRSGTPLATAYTLNYATGSPVTGTIASGEWYTGGVAGVYTPTSLYKTQPAYLANAGSLYEDDILTVDSTRVLNSITFSLAAAGADKRIDVFAISGTAVPEPSTLVLLSLGLVSLLAYAWRKRK